MRSAPAPGDPVEAIARAVLYEGYVLWPYRRSALKNRRHRFTFGGLYPAGFCAAARESDRSALSCECLVEGGPEAAVGIELRFLHRVHRQVLERTPEGERPVDSLRGGGRLHLTWDEAAERRATPPSATLAELAALPRRHELIFPGGRDDEPIEGDGEPAGALRRSWLTLRAALAASAERLESRLWRLRVEVANAGGWQGTDRDQAQRRSLLSTHLLLSAAGGAFVSAADPPPRLAAAAAGCTSEGVWPVLVGEPGSRDRVLASPIILEDHTRIAPESPGDLFDGGEIDQLLTLNVLALTDAEREEAAATDPRARAILERTERLTPPELMRLHGTFREPRRPPSGDRP